MFHSPWYFLLLLLIPWMASRLFGTRRVTAIGYSSLEFAQRLRPTLRQRLLWVPKVLMILAIILLIVSLARPREGREQTVVDTQGIAIQIVVDRSGSMRAMDFKINGDRVDRLTAIKNVAGKFILGEGELEGRFNDLIGLVTFARYADGVTPPTLDHSFLTSSLNSTKIVEYSSEDGTAIGDAVALSVEKLNALDERNADQVQSKIVILLTDGENTAGELEPIAAAELAQTMGIKIYPIGIGTKGQAPYVVQDSFTGRQMVQMMPTNIDEETLEKVAELTDGKYFRATDTDSLINIYAEIDQLEKSKIESENFTDYRELAVQSYRAGWAIVPPTLSISLVFLMTAVLLQNTWLREIA